MKYRLTIFFLFLFVNARSQDITGNWYGTVNTDDGSARIVITLYKQHEIYKGYIAMPDLYKLHEVLYFDSITVNKQKAFFSLKNKIKIFFNSIIDDSLANGVFSSSEPYLYRNIILRKVNEYPNLNRPQTPVPPFSYISKPVLFYDSLTQLKYQGILTIPKIDSAFQNKKFPVIVLLPGTGIHDMNYSSGAHKMFMVMADYLTRQGFAVLRKNSRGWNDTSTNFEQIPLPLIVDDAEAAVRFLKKQPFIDTSWIGLLGHSEGGLVAPALAAKNKSIKFMVLMGAPGISFKDISKEQRKKLLQEDKNLKNIQLDSASLNKLMDIIQKNSTSKRINYLFDYNPAIPLSKLTIPVLALNGNKDLQVNAKQNLPVIDSALKTGHNKNYKTIILQGLNHSFQTCIKCTYNETPFLEETISPNALEIIGKWLNENVKSKK